MSAAAAAAVMPTKPPANPVMEELEARWRPAMNLPCRLTVDLSFPNFKVSNLLALRAGSVIATHWQVTRDVPLRVNGTLIAWGELEAVGARLGVRLTELA